MLSNETKEKLKKYGKHLVRLVAPSILATLIISISVFHSLWTNDVFTVTILSSILLPPLKRLVKDNL